ncbi:glutamic-type intramembrane protease PrsW [Tuberibacillus calidus]|uniref:glutamic-type intramembrane protease PrsW n=1 Tax=Tuberibacillus calidus TaxID=340097 RepID=UPI00041200DE|nr:glutamic-type intramembrane protease PrsW [Tuberibacillus calidus]
MVGVISAAIAPGLALLSYIYLRDKYESEPIGMVVKLFIIGCLLVLPVMVIQYALQAEHLFQYKWVQSFLVAGLLEEFLKWFMIIYTAYHHAAFSERYDGIVYATAVSLGFATAENLFYIYAYGIHVAFWRALLPVSGHGLFGIIMGYYIGCAKFSKTPKRWLLLSLLLVSSLHGIYDYMVSAGLSWVYLILPFMLILWIFALYKMKRLNEKPDAWLARDPQITDRF